MQRINPEIMKEIQQLYHNNFGVAFYWKKGDEIYNTRVQIVFKETGFYLTEEQLQEFSVFINDCANMQCECCKLKNNCRQFLLRTPVPEVDLAVNYNEYMLIKDLVDGTLFNIKLTTYLSTLCRN